MKDWVSYIQTLSLIELRVDRIDFCQMFIWRVRPLSKFKFRSYDIYLNLYLSRLEEDHVDKTHSAVNGWYLTRKEGHIYTWFWFNISRNISDKKDDDDWYK